MKPLSKRVADLRREAQQLRLWGDLMSLDVDRETFRIHADSLDREATALESQVESAVRPEVVQQQQQQQADMPADLDKKD